MAEIELGVLARQCLDRRIPRQEDLARETGAWQATKPGGNSSGLALHHRGRPHQAQVSLPVNTIAADY